MVKPGKPKSKRSTVRLRHKIEKAGAAKQRKQRKAAKNNPEWRSRMKKDPGIPNLFPYKDRILQEIEEKKKLKEEEQARKVQEARLLRIQATKGTKDTTGPVGLPDDSSLTGDLDVEMEGDDLNPMAALLASAKVRATEYEEASDASESEFSEGEDAPPSSTSRKDPSTRAYSHLFTSVLSSADIILYVLDARDPPSTRSIPTERQITAHADGSKRVILVLNKIDLVPPFVLSGWLKHLRRYHPTLPLRASSAAANAKIFNHKALTQKATVETLLRALKSYAATQNLKRALTVGVIGFPNVGKSSVINALVGCLGRGNNATPAPVGAEAGVTTALRTVKLDSKLTLIDSPGVVFPPEYSVDGSSLSSIANKNDGQARLILLNALPPRSITDPLPAISLLLSRLATNPTARDTLLTHYGIPAILSNADGDATVDFLVQVARRRGRLGKGGVPNLEAAGKSVLADWRDGRLEGWVEAPILAIQVGKGMKNGSKSGADEKEIVANWAEEFKIDGLWGSQGEGEGEGMEE